MGFELKYQVEINRIPQLPYAVEEAVNRLRVNVGLMGPDIKKIMVVSTMPNEGKSFVSFQLWRQMAECGAKSLFLDMDLRNSVMEKEYQLQLGNNDAILGTSHYLANDIALEECIMRTYLEQGDMMVNVTNLVNPSTLITGKRLKHMLERLEQEYRYIFIDSPPLNLVSDGEMIGSMCDGAIVVVRGNVTSKRMVANTLQQLERSGCPVLGIVLSRVKGKAGGYYYKEYGKKYYGGKYYGEK